MRAKVASTAVLRNNCVRSAPQKTQRFASSRIHPYNNVKQPHGSFGDFEVG